MSRRERAEQFAQAVANSGYAPCRCVHESPDARAYVFEAGARICSALLAYELEGGPWSDVLAAEKAYAAEWQDAAHHYEIVDGSHPHMHAER